MWLVRSFAFFIALIWVSLIMVPNTSLLMREEEEVGDDLYERSMAGEEEEAHQRAMPVSRRASCTGERAGRD